VNIYCVTFDDHCLDLKTFELCAIAPMLTVSQELSTTILHGQCGLDTNWDFDPARHQPGLVHPHFFSVPDTLHAPGRAEYTIDVTHLNMHISLAVEFYIGRSPEYSGLYQRLQPLPSLLDRVVAMCYPGDELEKDEGTDQQNKNVPPRVKTKVCSDTAEFTAEGESDSPVLKQVHREHLVARMKGGTMMTGMKGAE